MRRWIGCVFVMLVAAGLLGCDTVMNVFDGGATEGGPVVRPEAERPAAQERAADEGDVGKGDLEKDRAGEDEKEDVEKRDVTEPEGEQPALGKRLPDRGDFDAIRPGMTRREVLGVLGRPTDVSRNALHWQLGEHEDAWVFFDESGKHVTSTYRQGENDLRLGEIVPRID